jgi:hypothetical protein
MSSTLWNKRTARAMKSAPVRVVRYVNGTVAEVFEGHPEAIKRAMAQANRSAQRSKQP